MLAGAGSVLSAAPSSSSTLQDGCDLSSCVSVIRPNDVNSGAPSGLVVALPSSERSFPPSGNAVNVAESSDVNLGPNFSDVVRGANPDPVEYVPDVENELPSRPLTVSFNPRARVPAHEVFTALREANIDNNSVSCVQRQSSGEIVLTFRNARAKEQFLTHNIVRVRGQPFALQDIDRPLTYVQVFDAPHEMPDETIIQRLAKYCDVLHHRRGYFREEGWTHVQDGVRHFRVRIKAPIPNFIRFGKILIHFRYDGQPRTCRHCNQTGHYVNACHSIICYNCEELGHLASDCPHDVLCNICKQPDHRAITCPFSWARQVPEHQPDNPPENPPDNEPDVSHEEVSREEVSREDVSREEDLSDEQIVTADPAVPSGAHSMELSTPEEYLSASEDSPPATLELFPNSVSDDMPPPRPQRSRSTSRRPAHVQPTVVPSRTPTQPVLVTGKSREDSNDNLMDTEQSSKATKRKSPEKPRTNKHKKNR